MNGSIPFTVSQIEISGELWHFATTACYGFEAKAYGRSRDRAISFLLQDLAKQLLAAPLEDVCDHGKTEHEECPACDHDRMSDGETDGARL